MIVRGKIVSGPHRGEGLIEHFYYRIIHTLGFEPFKGTLDVRTAKDVDIKRYAPIVLDHILLDGTRMIDAYLCPVKINGTMDAWIIQKHKDIHNKGIIEIISKEKIMDKLSLKEGDEVELDINDEKVKKSDRRKHLASRFRRKKYDIPHMKNTIK